MKTAPMEEVTDETRSTTASAAPVRQVPPVPPRLVLRAFTSLREALKGLVRRMVPAQVAMFELINGVYQTGMLRAVCKLGLADHLAGGPKTAAELARAAGANEEAIARVMRALVSIGIFERGRDGRFRLNRLGETLRSGVPGSMRDFAVLLGDSWHLNAWAAFPETLRTGTSGVELAHGKDIWKRLAGTEEARTFDGAMV